MKKIIIVQVCILCMLLTSCVDVTIETQLPSIPTEEATPTPTEDTVSLPTYITSVKDIGQIVYPLVNNDDYQDQQQLLSDNINTLNYIIRPRKSIDEDLPKNVTWNFNGVEFNLEYKWSSGFISHRNISDVYIDYYDSSENFCSIAFKHGTAQPIEFQFWDKNLSRWRFDTLEQYEDFLDDSILGNNVNLEQYEMTCTTEWKTTDGQKMTTDSFYTVENGEVLEGYYFRYITKNGNNDTGNIITISYFYMNIPGVEYALISFRDESSDYTYDKIIPISQKEIDYAKELVDDYVKGEDFGRRTETEFLMIDVLYGRKYLVYEFEHEAHGGNEIQRIYVDYERLQQKMALEGKT